MAAGKLGILLPLTSRGRCALAGIQAVEANVLASLSRVNCCEVIFGIDFDDGALLADLDALQQRCFQRGIATSVTIFQAAELEPARQRAAQKEHPAGTVLYGGGVAAAAASADAEQAPAAPLCYMWNRLASQAAARGCTCMVLLGDDTIVRPAGVWVDDALRESLLWAGHCVTCFQACVLGLESRRCLSDPGMLQHTGYASICLAAV